MKLVPIRLNTLPGLSDLPDEVTLPGYDARTDFVPEIDPNYVFDKSFVRILGGFLANDTAGGLMFSGPKGSGKSSGCHQLHAYLNRPLFYVSGQENLEYEDLLATKEIVGGDTIALDGPLLQAARTPYATFLFEEVDRARSKVSVALNPVLDGYSIINTLDSGVRIKPQEGFRMIFTGNTNGQGDMSGDYNSAVAMDSAFLDRILCYHVWYPEPEQEFQILRQKVPVSIEDEQLRKSIAFANDVRFCYADRSDKASSTAQSIGATGAIHTPISTRALVSLWETMIIHSRVESPIMHALKLVVTNKCTRTCAEAIEQLALAQFAGDS